MDASDNYDRNIDKRSINGRYDNRRENGRDGRVRVNSRQRKARRRRRLIRRFVRLVCRCVMLGLLAAVIVTAVKCYKSINMFDSIPFGQELGEEYPESLRTLFDKNPEAREFVLDYPKNKDKHPVIDLTEEVTKGTIPLFLQWDERWGYETYGSDFLAVTGCGPTCLSMVQCGLSGETKWNPLQVANMAEEDGYYVPGAGSSWDLMTEGAKQLGLIAESVTFDAAHILDTLESGSPIICIMGPGDFTTGGHFIILTGVDDDGMVTVCDPNSRNNSKRAWDVEELIPQIKNLWSYRYNV